MEALLVKLGVRFVIFGAVFAFAVKKNPKITVKPKIALPLVALVFALLNTGLYFLLKPVVSVATLGAAWLVLPFVLNGAFVWLTQKLIRPLRIDGLRPMLWLAVLLTAAHGLTWLIVDQLIYG
jgi:hypothetical protein